MSHFLSVPESFRFLLFVRPPLDFICCRMPVSYPISLPGPHLFCVLHIFCILFYSIFSFHYLPVSCFLICILFFIFKILSSSLMDLPLSDPLQGCSDLYCFALNFVLFILLVPLFWIVPSFLLNFIILITSTFEFI